MTNLQQRLMVAAVGIPLLLWAAIQGGGALYAVIAAIQAMALWEWRKLSAGIGAHLGLAGTAAVIAALDYVVFTHGSLTALGVFFAVLALALLAEVFRQDPQPLRNLGASALFVCYVGLGLALWGVLTDPPAAFRLQPIGPLALLFVTTWICDTAAYFGGRQFGKHKLRLAASPNKTVEGFVAGVILSALILPLAHALRLVAPAPADYIVLPLIVGVAGQAGDLLESLMKREVQVKDTSDVLPGHGGFLDRFDSLLISAPLLFAYLTLSPA